VVLNAGWVDNLIIFINIVVVLFLPYPFSYCPDNGFGFRTSETFDICSVVSLFYNISLKFELWDK